LFLDFATQVLVLGRVGFVDAVAQGGGTQPGLVIEVFLAGDMERQSAVDLFQEIVFAGIPVGLPAGLFRRLVEMWVVFVA
jgi:hypothetical protein